MSPSSSKSNVVYAGNLNSKMGNAYIESLMRNGHIMATDGKVRKYKTTDKGKQFLAIVKEVIGSYHKRNLEMTA